MDNQFFKGLVLACSIFFNANYSVSYSQKADTVRIYELQSIEVKGKKTPSNVLSGSPIQKIDISQLENLGSNQISDAVKRFSGITVKDYGGIGGLKTVSIRSMGAEHTAVSYDGIAVSDCQSGQIDISRFSLDNISEITLNIGQSDNIFQSAKMIASAGALNIDTYNPDYTNQKRAFLKANLHTGSFGLINPSLGVDYALSEKTSFGGNLNYLKADGFYPFKINIGQKEIEGKRINSDIESLRGELNFIYKPSQKQRVKLKTYYYNSERGLPGVIIVDNSYSAERLFDKNFFAQLQYENNISKNFKIKGAAKWNYSSNKDYNDQSSGITVDRFRQRESYATISGMYDFLNGLSLSLSQDFSYNDLFTTIRNCQFPERYTVLSALSCQYKNNRLTVTGSLLNTFITENVKSGEKADDRKKLSPALSLSYRVFEEIPLRIRLSYKDIFRTPTFNDMYYLLIGNSGLKPEKTKQINLGLTYGNENIFFLNSLIATIDIYYNRVDDKIIALPTMFIWKMMNADKVETLGADININAEKRISKHLNLSLASAYSYIKAENISDRNSKLWRNQIPYTPKHSGNTAFNIETEWITFNYNVNYSSIRYSLPQNDRDCRIDGYADQNISLSKKFSIGKSKLNIAAQIANIGGKNFEIIKNYPMAGRNFKISLNYTY
ncbi:MAG: TonB-dependent receptor [Bacteroidales bacterium]|nr:TonB-dependent receptor [Bacteroidales bacterium]